MSGQVIPFQGRRFHGRVVADVETHVERQLARIASLVDELEALTCNTMNLAPGLIARAHDTMERARGVLSSLGGGDEQDPQPDVDRELLARLYREVNPTK
jgi:DhnA family fructose-bisphosphate aldolase class Ia